MSGFHLIKKLGIKSGMLVSLVKAPENFRVLLRDIPEDIKFIKIIQGTKVDYLHAFFRNEKDLQRDIYFLKKHIHKEGMLWISWPKGSSGVDTDLNRDIIREMVLKEGLVDVKVCSIDNIWSALKFVYRLKDRY